MARLVPEVEPQRAAVEVVPPEAVLALGAVLPLLHWPGVGAGRVTRSPRHRP